MDFDCDVKASLDEVAQVGLAALRQAGTEYAVVSIGGDGPILWGPAATRRQARSLWVKACRHHQVPQRLAAHGVVFFVRDRPQPLG